MFKEENSSMKKNIKIVSLAAAALLAVSPVVASAVPVNAAASAKTTANSKSTKKTEKKEAVKPVNSENVEGTPYFVEGNNRVTSGSVSLKANTVSAIVDAITKKYSITTDGKNTVAWNTQALTIAITGALNSQAGISVNANGSFNMPANSFTVNAVLNYGKNLSQSITMPVNVTPYDAPADYSANPVISYNGKKFDHTQNITLADNASFNYVKVNGTVDTAAIQKAFTAQVSASDKNAIAVTVDTSKVNTAVAGQYPVTVTAINPAGKGVTLTFNLTVGEKGATYKTVNTQAVVYSINGNTVSQTTNIINVGTSIATFGNPVVVNNVSYTRINGASANQFVLTSVFDKVATDNNTNKDENSKPEVATKKITLLHAAAAYTKDGKRAGHTYKLYKRVTIEDQAVTINGAKCYKIANSDNYIKASNVDGKKRTLKRRSYIYKSSKRRANKKVLKKGKKVRTYGGSVKFKNGKRYYRIGKGQYVRTVNFR